MIASEKDVIDRVIDQMSDWSASPISDYSHKDLPWEVTLFNNYDLFIAFNDDLESVPDNTFFIGYNRNFCVGNYGPVSIFYINPSTKENLIDLFLQADVYESRQKNYTEEKNHHDRDYFDSMTDGQLGDYNDFGGNIDDIDTWSRG